MLYKYNDASYVRTSPSTLLPQLSLVSCLFLPWKPGIETVKKQSSGLWYQTQCSGSLGISFSMLIAAPSPHPKKYRTWALSWTPPFLVWHTRSAFSHLSNIACLWASLSDSVAETLTHVFIFSCLDDCNRVLFGVLQNPGITSPPLLSISTRSWSNIASRMWHLYWFWLSSCRITFGDLIRKGSCKESIAIHFQWPIEFPAQARDYFTQLLA